MKRKLFALLMTMALILSLFAGCAEKETTGRLDEGKNNNPAADEKLDKLNESKGDGPAVSEAATLPSELINNGIPRDKTMTADLYMRLYATTTIESDDAPADDDQVVDAVDMDIIVNAKMAIDNVNERSSMDGEMEIYMYGLDMTAKMLTYTDKDVTWDYDETSGTYVMSVDEDYAQGQNDGIAGLTSYDFNYLDLTESNDTYTLTGTLDMSEENTISNTITNLTGSEADGANIMFTANFDKATRYLKDMTLELSAPSVSDDGLLTINSFVYTVTVTGFSDETIELPEEIQNTNNADNKNPNDVQSKYPGGDDGIPTIEPTVDEETGELVFVIESEPNSTQDNTQTETDTNE